MVPSEYKKFVSALISPPNVAKPGVRKAISTKKNLNIFHGVVGVKSEVGELLHVLNSYVLGFPLNDADKIKAREEVGDTLFYLILLAKELKVKVPAFKRRVKLKTTPTDALLKLDSHSTEMLDAVKKAFYGREISKHQLANEVQACMDYVYGLSLMLFGEPVESLVAENVAKLRVRYPERFTPEGELNRDPEKEQQAVAELKAA